MKSGIIEIFKVEGFLRKLTTAFFYLLFGVVSFFSVLNFFAAERLPLKIFTTADGLASSVIHHVARDSRGFLWFCARGGLSRYDGFEFVSYRIGDETPGLVHYFLETRDGVIWISTDNGLYRVKPQEKSEILPVEKSFPTNERRLDAVKVANHSFYTLFEDSKGRLWGGSNDIYLIEDREAESVRLERKRFLPDEEKRQYTVSDITETADGSLWAASSFSIARLLQDGRFINYEVANRTSRDESYAIKADAKGRIWFSHIRGIFVFQPESLETLKSFADKTVIKIQSDEVDLQTSGKVSFPTGSKKMLHLLPKSFDENGLKGDNKFGSSVVEDFLLSSDGKIWLPTRRSLYVFDGENYQILRDATALPGITKGAAEDLQGNLWFGGFSGVIQYKLSGLITYNEQTGMPDPVIHQITESPSGEVLAFHGNWQASRATAAGLETVQLNMPETARFSWTSQPIFQDQNGGFWVLTLKGLFRYPPTANFSSLASVAPQNVSFPGLISKEKPMYRAFAGSGQTVWFASRGGGGQNDDNQLFHYDLKTGEWQDFSKIEGYPKGYAAVSYAEDAAGNLWFGFYGRGGLFRLSNNRFTEFTVADGLPDASIFALHVDSKGRLWIGSSGDGLARIDEPSAEKPQFVHIRETEGLSANNVRCLAEDTEGNIYAGTVRGVSQIDAANGRIKQITTVDGLAADFVHAAFRDSRGAMWFGTANGLSKYVPVKQNSMPAPQVYINNLRIGGVDYALSEFGQKTVSGIETDASSNNLQINFSSIGEPERVKYQYRLDGAWQSEWTSTGERRSINFANLAPGSYRFLVRATSGGEAADERFALVAFKINPPFYQTWWFLVLATIVVIAILFAIYRYRTQNLLKINAALAEAKLAEEKLGKAREERLAELQKVRTRIATDLHDDIGSSLSQIALYSELARQRASENGAAGESLDMITNVANELVDTMSDIVWAINPKKDHLQDLTQRMRRFAANVLTAKDIDLEFRAPVSDHEIPLGANIRREVFLIFKETVNNIAKHSEATEAEIAFAIEKHFLSINFRDNGKGFDQNAKSSENGHQDWQKFRGGNGLLNMKRRAEDLGGGYEIESAVGKGTAVILRIPLDLKDKG